MSIIYPEFRKELFIHEEDNRILFLNPEAPDWITINIRYKKIFDCFTGKNSIDEINDLIMNEYSDESNILIPQIKTFIQDSKLFTHNELNIKTQDLNFKPKYVYLTLTDDCNLNCIYCYRTDRRRKESVSFNEWRFYIDSILDIVGECTFIFTGGEPLLVPYLFKLAEYINKMGSSSILLTNGTKITTLDIANKLAYSFKHIRISLDSINEDISSKLRGCKTLAYVDKAIKYLETAGANYVVVATVNALNKDEIDLFADYFNNKVHFQPFYEMGEGRLCPELAITGVEYYDSLTKTSAFKYLHGFHNNIYNFKNNPNKRCALAKEEISIDSNGDVYPCHLLHYDELKLGNLHNTNLSEIYYLTPLINDLRKVDVDNIKQCKTCEFRNFCGGACRARVDFKERGISGFNSFCDFEKKAILKALLYSFG